MSLYLWEKSVAAAQTEIWCERLRVCIPPEMVAVVARVGHRTQSIQVYCGTELEASELKRRHGGHTCEIMADRWQPGTTTPAGQPLSFAGNLLITGRTEELESLRAMHPSRHVLCIPAAMAFGTGEHATTAMCLRFLAETGARLNRLGKWRLLDLGSGSGVLALAGKLFGASRASGVENDPHAIRTARENALANSIKNVAFHQADLLRSRWPLRTKSGWDVVTANLFSELLIALLPQIAAVLNAGGCLIASGILAGQADEVLAIAEREQLRVTTKRRRGRWLAFRALKIG